MSVIAEVCGTFKFCSLELSGIKKSYFPSRLVEPEGGVSIVYFLCLSPINLLLLIYMIYIHTHTYIHTYMHIYIYIYSSLPGGSDGEESAYNAGDPCSIPGSGSPGEGNGYPLQDSGLKNHPMDRGVWQATVHGVTVESR